MFALSFIIQQIDLEDIWMTNLRSRGQNPNGIFRYCFGVHKPERYYTYTSQTK